MSLLLLALLNAWIVNSAVILFGFFIMLILIIEWFSLIIHRNSIVIFVIHFNYKKKKSWLVKDNPAPEPRPAELGVLATRYLTGNDPPVPATWRVYTRHPTRHFAKPKCLLFTNICTICLFFQFSLLAFVAFYFNMVSELRSSRVLSLLWDWPTKYLFSVRWFM